ncbi:hypothetical protein [Emticicia sp. SJ17W-69]|uniref:hypothetical protein n=1 Tax=Emticicia sp. SJ17W-69 TaxID=3421657 RepID=UPI003EC0A954
MKNKVLIGILLFFTWSCVQKSYKRTVVFTLDVSNLKNIKTVGLRGEGKPLTWDNDLAMKPIKKDSLYAISITAMTGYKFIDVKFVVNGEFELQNKPNRRVIFNENGVTNYDAIFNIEKK